MALSSISECLEKELAPLGISVIIVERGAFRTDFFGISIHVAVTAIDDYADTAGDTATGWT